MNEYAARLNDVIMNENPYVFGLLSDLGKKVYYPKGILSQGAEASEKAFRFNATVGIATEGEAPMHFEHVQELLPFVPPEDIYPYAPPGGGKLLREEWKKKLLRENPSMQEEWFGLPVATNGITHGLSLAADLFVDEGDVVILSDKHWENYHFIFEIRRGATISTFELFDEEGYFNTESFRKCLLRQKNKGKAIVLLNFPNNPTGYTPHESEVRDIISVLVEVADEDINLSVILDDAYFGLFFEDSIRESLFGRLMGIHPRILPIKLDGATKENYAWGLRVGFLTISSESPALLGALEQKAMGLIRGMVSSGPNLSQSIILQSLQSPRYEDEKKQKYTILKRRALRVKALLTKEKYRHVWDFYPFNSGYFMCLKLLDVHAEELRLHLLERYGVGTIAINTTDLRIAFSCVEEDKLEELFELIYAGTKDVMRNDRWDDLRKGCPQA